MQEQGLKFNPNLFSDYVICAPLALAFERILEGRIYQAQLFERPVLDIGCGEGLFARMVFAEKIDTGVDPNARELERARELGAYTELIECYGHDIAKPNGSYRTIFSNSVLEHIPDLDPVLREAYRVLAPGGHFYFTVPSTNFERFTWISLILEKLGLNFLANRYRRFFNRFWSHFHTYPLEGWLARAKSAGFTIVEAYTYDPVRACLLNSALTPLGLIAKIIKKYTNRWVLFPLLRRFVTLPIACLAFPMLRGGEKTENGGLVFVSLRKRL
jgi:SAM-dependent methyltransferase